MPVAGEANESSVYLPAHTALSEVAAAQALYVNPASFFPGFVSVLFGATVTNLNHTETCQANGQVIKSTDQAYQCWLINSELVFLCIRSLDSLMV